MAKDRGTSAFAVFAAQEGLNISTSCHIGGNTEEAQIRMAELLVDRIRNAIDAREISQNGSARGLAIRAFDVIRNPHSPIKAWKGDLRVQRARA